MIFLKNRLNPSYNKNYLAAPFFLLNRRQLLNSLKSPSLYDHTTFFQVVKMGLKACYYVQVGCSKYIPVIGPKNAASRRKKTVASILRPTTHTGKSATS